MTLYGVYLEYEVDEGPIKPDHLFHIATHTKLLYTTTDHAAAVAYAAQYSQPQEYDALYVPDSDEVLSLYGGSLVVHPICELNELPGISVAPDINSLLQHIVDPDN